MDSKYFDKYLKYKNKYLKYKKSIGGTLTLEQLIKNKLIVPFSKDLNCYDYIPNSLKASTIGPLEICLTDHYSEENIVGIFKDEPYQCGTFECKKTSRGDIIVKQRNKDSCSITSAYMIALSNNFNIPEQFIIACTRMRMIFDLMELTEYANMLGKKLLIETMNSIEDYEKFINQYNTV